MAASRMLPLKIVILCFFWNNSSACCWTWWTCYWNEVFSYCSTTDLKMLSCCSRKSRDVCHGKLWHTVTVPQRDVLRCSLAHDCRLEYLRYTKVRKIEGVLKKGGYKIHYKVFILVMPNILSMLVLTLTFQNELSDLLIMLCHCILHGNHCLKVWNSP